MMLQIPHRLVHLSNAMNIEQSMTDKKIPQEVNGQ